MAAEQASITQAQLNHVFQALSDLASQMLSMQEKWTAFELYTRNSSVLPQKPTEPAAENSGVPFIHNYQVPKFEHYCYYIRTY